MLHCGSGWRTDHSNPRGEANPIGLRSIPVMPDEHTVVDTHDTHPEDLPEEYDDGKDYRGPWMPWGAISSKSSSQLWRERGNMFSQPPPTNPPGECDSRIILSLSLSPHSLSHSLSQSLSPSLSLSLCHSLSL